MSIVKRVADRFAKTSKLEALPSDEPFIDEILQKRRNMTSVARQLVKEANDIIAKISEGDVIGAHNALARTLEMAAYVAEDLQIHEAMESIKRAADEVTFASHDLMKRAR